MKKTVALLMAAIMGLSMVGCGGGEAGESKETKNDSGTAQETAAEPAAGGETLKIGFCMPLTGNSATSGKYAEMGADLAVEEINAAGGVTVGDKTYQLELVKEDNEGKTEVTINAYNKLIGDDKVLAIIGPQSSAALIAAAPSATSQKTPVIGTTTSNPDCTLVGGDYVFRACWIDDYQGLICAKMAKEELGLTKVAVLYSNASDYSTGLYNVFKEEFEKLGGEIITAEAYAGADTKDFKAQLTAIKESGAEGIFFPNESAEIPLQIQQARELGLEMELFGEMSWDNPLLPELAGAEVLEGTHFVSLFAVDSSDPIAQKFVKAFQEKYDTNPNTQATMNYDSVMILVDALKRCGTAEDPAAFRDAIAATEIDLPSGHLVFDENRDPQKNANVMVYKDGQAAYVTSIAP